jgi:S-(hydroxymethyl)glutathione dehydrogenase/alcohol dehydrogenase
MNTVQLQPQMSFAVFGCGGIGLSALIGAQIGGCRTKIAIDPNKQKLKMAEELGATHMIDPNEVDPVEAIRKIGPLDVAIEASGNLAAMDQALRAVRAQGGIAVIAGNAPFGQRLSLDPKELNQGKRLLGTWGGENLPDLHFPRYCSWIEERKIDLSLFTQSVYPLSKIDQAFQDLEAGKVLRPLLEMKGK